MLNEEKNSIHGQWSSRWMFILAATGSAVGLGNIWKFPYVTGENGGGAFILVYLLCVAIIGIPVMMAEVMLGRRGRQSPVNTMSSLAKEARRHQGWTLLGWWGVAAGFIILSYYSVVAGWALAYVPRMASGLFAGADAGRAIGIFEGLLGNPIELLAWHTVFMIMTVMVIARGVEKGLERAVSYLMPALFILLLVLVGYAVSTGEFMHGVRFMFNMDFSKLNAQSVLTAMGLAFFSLSLGMGAIMMYGAYLPKSASITQSVISIAVADTLVAMLAGLAIFPVVFANGLNPDDGPGLVFVTLPIAFGNMQGGLFFGTLFFLLLVFAAWTSGFSLLEPAVAWLVESRKMSRAKAVSLCGFLIWTLGLLSVFSFNLLSKVKPIGDKIFFDLLDFLAQNIMLPLGGLFIALFAAWLIHEDAHKEELDPGISYRAWLFLIRYIAPVGVVLVFLHAIKVFSWFD
ncbi:MAG: sodium-dependent transporter [Gammaproteobacteria bacterium]|nr:sodium-dependent transporter [Gammaproteobacteria bacterium]